MRKQELTIDINALNLGQLREIMDILLSLGKSFEAEQVKESIGFFMGKLPESALNLHYDRFYA
jgi:hypothetical protein